MIFKTIMQRFSHTLTQRCKNKQPQQMQQTHHHTASHSQTDSMPAQLTTLQQHYQQNPSQYLTPYLQQLNQHLQYLITQRDPQAEYYYQQLITLYQSLPVEQLQQHSQDYADTLMDYALYTTEIEPHTNPPPLEKTDLELYDSFQLTALDCYINSLDKTQHYPQALAISQEMLTISKRAMQQSTNIQRQQEYLNCLQHHLQLQTQHNLTTETNGELIAHCQQALSLYQTLYQQGTGFERPYADLLTHYNQLLNQPQQLSQAIACNQQIISQCLQHYQQDPDNFTGYLYRTALELISHNLDNTAQSPLAEELFKQAVEIFAELTEQDPSETQHANYAYVLTQYAKYLAQNQQTQQAIAYSQQSVALYIELLSQSAAYESASEQALIQYQILTGQI